MSDRILVIAAHADDETLGCGGTLLKHRAAGDEIAWLIATRAHAPQWPPDVVEKKQAEIDRVAGAYGVGECFRLDAPSTRLDTLPQAELIARIRSAIEAAAPQTVYLPHWGDVHTDHQAVCSATMSVLKTFYQRRFGVRRVLAYETLSSTDAAPSQPHRAFVPTVFIDIGDYLDRKIDIMALYETEQQSELLPRGASAIRALARYRGATIGCEYAEAFMLVREIA